MPPQSDLGSAAHLPADALAPVSDATLFASRPVIAADLPDIEALHDQAFGPGALTRTAYRVREGQPPATPFCRVVHREQALVASIRFTAIRVGGAGPALMLGPLAVAASFANQGHGRRLIAEGLFEARQAGIPLVLLIGDPPYYARFGFAHSPAGRIVMPGPVDPARLLVAELLPGAAAHLRGRVTGAV